MSSPQVLEHIFYNYITFRPTVAIRWCIHLGIRSLKTFILNLVIEFLHVVKIRWLPWEMISGLLKKKFTGDIFRN